MKSEGFNERVYRIVRDIPAGCVATYGQVAMLAGAPRAARAVGWAMRRCPSPEIPCHRVVNAQGTLAPEGVFGGAEIQRRLLQEEGVVFRPGGTVDMEQCRWAPWNV